MCMSAKVPAVVRLAAKALMENKCVVIGLQSTGEARTEEAVTKYVRFFFLHFLCPYFLSTANKNVLISFHMYVCFLLLMICFCPFG